MAKNETLARRIRRLREGQGLTPGGLGLKMQCESGRTLVGQWESGATAPSAKWIVPLADALGVSCDELLRGSR